MKYNVVECSGICRHTQVNVDDEERGGSSPSAEDDLVQNLTTESVKD
jgi:hypothetical protein